MYYLKQALLIIVGSISLAVGIMGIVLPLIPTTPLLLLAAACYIRSSKRLYNWLITNKYFGSYIENYRSGKGIPLKAKIISILLIWISMSFTVVFVIPLLAVKLLFLVVAGYFTWFIWKQKTLQKDV